MFKFLHSGSPSYFEQFLSFSSCPYSTRHSHPDRQYLTVPPFHSSVFKPAKYFGHSFAFDATKILNELPQDVRSATSVEGVQHPPSHLCLLDMTWSIKLQHLLGQ